MPSPNPSPAGAPSAGLTPEERAALAAIELPGADDLQPTLSPIGLAEILPWYEPAQHLPQPGQFVVLLLTQEGQAAWNGASTLPAWYIPALLLSHLHGRFSPFLDHTGSLIPLEYIALWSCPQGPGR